jgi:uncharacterized membrane protein YjjP (DUF1212 family)
MEDDELRQHARKRLKERQDFHNYLLVWLGVALVSSAIWVLTNPGGYFWPAWAIAGMGVGAVFQAIAIYGGKRFITEADVDAEVERLRGPKNRG